MDNYIDKLASRLSSQEVIRANAEAERAEMERLRLQVAEYEKILQEMRKLNYKNSELSGRLESELGENTKRIKDLQAEELGLITTLRDLTQDQIKAREEEIANREAAAKDNSLRDMEKIEDFFVRSDEFVHKENVKVYRNVQAVVVDELAKQKTAIDESMSETIQNAMESKLGEMQSKINIIMICTVLALIASLGSVAFNIMTMLNIF